MIIRLLLRSRISNITSVFCVILIIRLITEDKMMDASKVSDDEILQDLQMLPEGGKEVCMNLHVPITL